MAKEKLPIPHEKDLRNILNKEAIKRMRKNVLEYTLKESSFLQLRTQVSGPKEYRTLLEEKFNKNIVHAYSSLFGQLKMMLGEMIEYDNLGNAHINSDWVPSRYMSGTIHDEYCNDSISQANILRDMETLDNDSSDRWKNNSGKDDESPPEEKL